MYFMIRGRATFIYNRTAAECNRTVNGTLVLTHSSTGMDVCYSRVGQSLILAHISMGHGNSSAKGCDSHLFWLIS